MLFSLNSESLKPLYAVLRSLPPQVDTGTLKRDLDDLSSKTFHSVQERNQYLNTLWHSWDRQFNHITYTSSDEQRYALPGEVFRRLESLFQDSDSPSPSSQSSPPKVPTPLCAPPNITPLYSTQSSSDSLHSTDSVPPAEMTTLTPDHSSDEELKEKSSGSSVSAQTRVEQDHQGAPSCSATGTLAATSSKMEPKDPSPLHLFFFRPALSKKLTAWFKSLYQYKEKVGDRLLAKLHTLPDRVFHDPEQADEYLFRILQECMLYLPSGEIDPLSTLLPTDMDFLDLGDPNLLHLAPHTLALLEMTPEVLAQLRSEAQELTQQLSQIQQSVDSDSIKAEQALPIQKKLDQIIEQLRFSILDEQARATDDDPLPTEPEEAPAAREWPPDFTS